MIVLVASSTACSKAAIQGTAQEQGREVIPPEETEYELHNLIKS